MSTGPRMQPPWYHCPDCKRMTYVGPSGERSCQHCHPDVERPSPPEKPELPDYPD